MKGFGIGIGYWHHHSLARLSFFDVFIVNLCSVFRVHKLYICVALAASVYLIWQERNRRTFSDEKRPHTLLIKEILAVIRLKMDWERDRKKVCHGVLGS